MIISVKYYMYLHKLCCDKIVHIKKGRIINSKLISTPNNMFIIHQNSSNVKWTFGKSQNWSMYLNE